MVISIEILGVMIGLFGIGIGYNALVAWMEREGHAQGYLAYLVAAGVLLTLAGAGVLIGWDAALITLACFAASGLPMIAGSMLRNSQRQKADTEKARRLALEIIEAQGRGDDQ